MEQFWWFFTIVLLAVGLIGSVLPAIPGATIILAAAVMHRIMLGPEKSLGWRALTVLVLLTLATYAIDVLSGYFGAKYFGATKWGSVRRNHRRDRRTLFRDYRTFCWTGHRCDRR